MRQRPTRSSCETAAYDHGDHRGRDGLCARCLSVGADPPAAGHPDRFTRRHGRILGAGLCSLGSACWLARPSSASYRRGPNAAPSRACPGAAGGARWRTDALGHGVARDSSPSCSGTSASSWRRSSRPALASRRCSRSKAPPARPARRGSSGCRSGPSPRVDGLDRDDQGSRSPRRPSALRPSRQS